MKKFIAILLVAVTVFTVFAAVGFSSMATDVDESYYVSGDYSYSVLGDTDAKIVGYSGADIDLVIAEKLDNYRVTYIDEMAFMGCSFLSVTVPQSVSFIKDYAFVGCESLTDITILNFDCEIFDSEYVIPENAKIYGYNNSTAHDYAVKYNRQFESLDEFETQPTEPIPTETEPSTSDKTEPTAPASPDQIKPTEPIVPTLGDVDMDGYVSVMDATAIQQHVSSLVILDEENLSYADADKDGVVSVMDATLIQMVLASLVLSL